MAKLFLFWVGIHAKIGQQLVLINSIVKSNHAALHHAFLPLHSLCPNVYNKLTFFPLHCTNIPTNTSKSWFCLLEIQEITNTMSLNCLTCSPLLPRTDSFEELFPEKEYKEHKEYKEYKEHKEIKETWNQVDRSWSNNKLPSALKRELPKVGAVGKLKGDHRRNYSTGDVPYPGASEPKLMRSSGMRRNWSLEDLTEKQERRVRFR
ncbi:uncharacterized protein HKW66_Vig0243330 [Vigna angularis]|uniref:Uncharacterized protein n=2 Tax=Phaseolus angularis TaxID=3914 RepID=A0A8T0JP69_PHAAN|nr:uncharacterized protein HKW66_Vig0243330 [Vigna angularis]